MENEVASSSLAACCGRIFELAFHQPRWHCQHFSKEVRNVYRCFHICREGNTGIVELVSAAAFNRAESKTLGLPLWGHCVSDRMAAGKER